MSKIIEPDFNTWYDVINNNSSPSSLGPLTSLALISFRKETLDQAINYTSNLVKIARKHGINLTNPVVENSNKILASGHQPDIVHSGIDFKLELLNQASTKYKITSINFIIDTDFGEAGEFIFPNNSNNFWKLDKTSINNQAGIRQYNYQVLASASAIKATFESVIKNFKILGADFVTENINKASLLYCKLTGLPLVEANDIVRRALKPSSYLSLPLSNILNHSLINKLFLHIINDAKKFASLYNENLNNYRLTHKIDNTANPFPNLEINQAIELPFWEIKNDTRKTLSFSNPDNINIEKIVPKAQLITFILRYLASDLFIHGLGGAKYDQVTDSLFTNYFKVVAPKYITASQTKFLFESQVKRINKIEQLKTNLRLYSYNPEKYFEQNIFSVSLKEKLKKLLVEKESIRSKLILEKQAGNSTAKISKEMQGIADEIKAAITTEHEQELAYLDNLDSQVKDIYLSREYPWFLF